MIVCNCLLSILLVIATAANAIEPSPVAPRKAETLDPEDIGIGKYVFESSPPAGKVMVLRCSKHDTDVKPDIVSETISYTNGAPARQVVLVFDPSRFPFNPDPDKPNHVRVRAQAGEDNFTGMRWKGTDTVGRRLNLYLSNDTGRNARWTYECFVEDYASVKARVADLPELPAAGGKLTAWTFNNGPQHSDK